jgi:hypothetical protein
MQPFFCSTAKINTEQIPVDPEAQMHQPILMIFFLIAQNV